MNRLSKVNLNSHIATRRRLVVERLEHRQLLSAMNVFITTGQVDESVSVESPKESNCQVVALVSNGLSPFSGFYASQGDMQGSAIARPEQPSGTTKSTPIDGALSSNNRMTESEGGRLTPPSQEREWTDEDIAEGENTLDPSAPPNVIDPPIDQGRDIVPVPTLQQAVMPFGYYYDSIEGQSSFASVRADTSSDQLELYGGYVELQLLRRYDFDASGDYRDTWSEPDVLDSAYVPADADDDEPLKDLGLIVAEDFVSAEEIELQVDIVEGEIAAVDNDHVKTLSAADHAAFYGDFGGMITYAFDESGSTVASQTPTKVANHPQERPREQYQIVDAILENTQAFDVMSHEAAVRETGLVETSTEALETTSQRNDASAPVVDAESDPKSKSVSTAPTDMSVVSSASFAFLVASNRRKRKRPTHLDHDELDTLVR